MDFAQPVSFENADIGQCPEIGLVAAPLPEKEDEDKNSRATVLIHPEPDTKEKKESATSPPLPPLPPSHVSASCFYDSFLFLIKGSPLGLGGQLLCSVNILSGMSVLYRAV